MPKLAALAAALLLALAACGGDGDSAATDTSSDAPAPVTTAPEETGTEPAEDAGTVTIETADGPVEVAVEVADSDAERERGLMDREALPDDAGMLFVFDEDVSFGFWMKNTLIPLSIAFADAEGEIVRILDMDPCEAEPCPVYEPEATYRTALEVNQGAFAEWGVAEGDRMALDR